MKKLVLVALVVALASAVEAATLRDGEAKWAGGDKVGATAVWREVLATSKDASELVAVRMRLASAAVAAGDASEAKAMWATVASTSGDANVVALAKVRLAYLAIKLKAPIADQIKAFLEIADKYPNAAAARDCLLRAALLKDKQDKASGLAAFEQVILRYPGTKEAAEASYRKGLVCERDRSTIDEAIAALDYASSIGAADPFTRQRAAVELGYAHIMKYMGSDNEEDLKETIEHLTAVLPMLRDTEMRVRAHLAMGECYLLLEDKPLKQWPPDETEFAAKEQQHYPVHAEKEYRAALAENGSSYQKNLARYGLAHTLRVKKDYEAAQVVFGELLAAMPGSTLIEKTASWQKLGLASTPSGLAAGAGHHWKWGELPLMAAYWRGACLASFRRNAEAKAIYEQIISEYGGQDLPPCLVKAARQGIADMEGEPAE